MDGGWGGSAAIHEHEDCWKGEWVLVHVKLYYMLNTFIYLFYLFAFLWFFPAVLVLESYLYYSFLCGRRTLISKALSVLIDKS